MIKDPRLALAISIGLLPPIWAVVSGHLGITCGAVALICAGIFVTAGNKVELGLPMSLGFLLSDLMAVCAIWLMENLPFPGDGNTFITLAVLGFLAVLLCTRLEKVFFLIKVLCFCDSSGLIICINGGCIPIGTKNALPCRIQIIGAQKFSVTSNRILDYIPASGTFYALILCSVNGLSDKPVYHIGFGVQDVVKRGICG